MELAILGIYALGALFFFISLMRDKYVEHTKPVVLVFILASIIWPVSGLIYILDVKK